MTDTEVKERAISKFDRCDSCNAQAWVIVKGLSGQLYFCSHHFNKNEDALFNWAYDIIDEREFINDKPSSE